MERLLSESWLEDIYKKLKVGNDEIREFYPGEGAERQPVHTVYGGAHLFKAETAQKIGSLAKSAFEKHASDSKALRQALGAGWSDELSEKIHARVGEKLKREAVEDFRIDFEDGFGNRPDDEEDRTALKAASEVARAMEAGLLPPFIGIRIKTLSEELKARSLKTLDLFVSELISKTGGKLPSNFVVTLPKITHTVQVDALVQALSEIERVSRIPADALKLEFMIESPQSLFDSNGVSQLQALLRAARGRCVAAHFGTYDYTASCSITASHQEMDHGACDFARNLMKVAYSGTGLWLSDGATNVMPVGDEETIHRAWQLSYRHIQHSLRNAFYQGWDLHPAQLPVRYAAVYSFFLEGLDSASERLKNFIEKAAQATLVGDVFDDAATGQGLLNYFLRAYNCGAIGEGEVEATGLSMEEVRGKSFLKILGARRRKS